MNELDENIGVDETPGGRMVIAREAQELSTAQLARRMGVETDTLSAWETDRAEPRPNQLVRVCGLLNVSPTWVLTGAGETPSVGMTPTDMMQIRSVIARLAKRTQAIIDELNELDERLATYQSYQD